ncbi:MAG: beta-ketoacyl synthase N-terminal-like domain-containing protein, partial [Gemmataceae bacterium]
MTRRVVVTGLGVVTSLGQDVATMWQGLLEGKSGISRIELFDPAPFKVQFAGEVKTFPLRESLDPKQLRRLDRFAQFAVVAAQEAFGHSGLDLAKEDPFRCGVIVGSGIGGLKEFEDQHSRYIKDGPGKISPFTIPKMISNAAAGNVSIELGFTGINTCVSTACASATHSIG